MIVVAVPVRLCQIISQLAVADGLCFLAEIHAGLVQGNRIERGQHTDVRKNRRIIFRMAVAVGGNIRDQADMETGSSVADSLAVFCYFFSQNGICVLRIILNGVKGAGPDTSATALAEIMINIGFSCIIGNGVGTALSGTSAAASAVFLDDMGLSGIVLLHLASPASTAHADILQGSSESGGLVSLEMCQGQENIRVHDGMADIGFLKMLAVTDRHFNVVRSAQPVADNDLAPCCHIVESVYLRAVQMIRRVFPGTRIQGIAVGQEWGSPVFLNHVCHSLDIVRAQIGNIAQLTKMHFYGDQLSVHINVSYARLPDQLLQLHGKRHCVCRTEIRKVYLGSFFSFAHNKSSSLK